MADFPDGVSILRSAYPFLETLERLQSALAAHGATIFATIDHRAAAATVGLVMPPATLIVFGNPQVGTPLMVERLLVALDLPSKVLVSEATSGDVTVSFNTTEYLARRYALSTGVAHNLSALEKLVKDAVTR